MFAPAVWNEIALNLGLSARELQIVRGTFDDQTESVIATNLRIALSTVHTHMERLHRKLGVPDRAQLILRVVQKYMALTVSPGSRLPPICANRAMGQCPLGHEPDLVRKRSMQRRSAARPQPK
jgi:DNA-binding CsgD family transcriptional regulator